MWNSSLQAAWRFAPYSVISNRVSGYCFVLLFALVAWFVDLLVEVNFAYSAKKTKLYI